MRLNNDGHISLGKTRLTKRRSLTAVLLAKVTLYKGGHTAQVVHRRPDVMPLYNNGHISSGNAPPRE